MHLDEINLKIQIFQIKLELLNLPDEEELIDNFPDCPRWASAELDRIVSRRQALTTMLANFNALL
jgi:hypothetical protein